MATAITLLAASKNSYEHKYGNGVAMPVPHKELRKHHVLTGMADSNSQFTRTKLCTLHIDPIPLSELRCIDCFDSLELLPMTSDGDLSHRVIHLKGPDSCRGIKHSILDSMDAGQTVPKIPSEAESGPTWNVVRILRENWNRANISQIGEHHKNQLDSHNTNSIEKASHNHRNDSKMTARLLPKEHLPSRRMDLALSRGHGPTRSRIRSRSIAIKRPSNDEKLEEIRQNSLAAEYDWATWRMYNRIIDHRQKHPLPYQHDESFTSLDASSSSLHKDGWDSFRRPITNCDENLTTRSLQAEQVQQYYPEYGEVFELDL
jgi:hypothetical protein